MKRYTTIIFDCDGTILNTLDDLRDSMNYILKKHNYPTRTLAEIRSFVGNGLGKLVERSVLTGTDLTVPQEQLDTMLIELKAYYADHNNDKTAPYDGIYDLLAVLKEQGYKMAVVSNKVQEGVTALNDEYFKEYFKVAIGETPDIKRKPEPDMVHAALKELNSTPEEAVYVGDSEVDLQTAKNSGLLPIAVTWGFRDEELLRELGAEHVAHKPRDVMEIIEELNKK